MSTITSEVTGPLFKDFANIPAEGMPDFDPTGMYPFPDIPYPFPPTDRPSEPGPNPPPEPEPNGEEPKDMEGLTRRVIEYARQAADEGADLKVSSGIIYLTMQASSSEKTDGQNGSKEGSSGGGSSGNNGNTEGGKRGGGRQS